MSIDWLSFVIVVGTSLLAASVLVTLFAAGLRIADGEAAWRRPASVAMFVLCGLVVAFGIYLIIPALHS